LKIYKKLILKIRILLSVIDIKNDMEEIAFRQ